MSAMFSWRCGELTVAGCTEYHFSVQVAQADSFEDAMRALQAGHQDAMRAYGLDASTLIMERYFCGDICLCGPQLYALPMQSPCFRVVLGQSPLDSDWCSLHAYHIDGGTSLVKQLDSKKNLTVRHGTYLSHWGAYEPSLPGTAYVQSNEIIAELVETLAAHAMQLEEHVLRTWYYVRDIDNNYYDMMRSRRENYDAHHLSAETHALPAPALKQATSRQTC